MGDSLLGPVLGPIVFFGFIIGYFVYRYYQWQVAEEERKKEGNLKYTNPQVYAQLKQIEHEQEMMQEMMAHDEKRMRHDNVQTGARLVSAFFRFWR
jgi:hypothetical protein